jgi:hypothetical protein
MTINEINKSYEKIGFMNENLPMICIVLFMILAIIPLLIELIIVRTKLKDFWKNKLSGYIKIIGIIAFCVTSYNLIERNTNDVEAWKENIKTEYIEKLPKEKIEIEDFFIVESQDKKNDLEYFTKNIEYTNIVEVIYLVDGIKTKKTLEVIIKKNVGLDKPYVEYRNLKTNLPLKMKNNSNPLNKNYIFKKGNYNTILYIPE